MAVQGEVPSGGGAGGTGGVVVATVAGTVGALAFVRDELRDLRLLLGGEGDPIVERRRRRDANDPQQDEGHGDGRHDEGMPPSHSPARSDGLLDQAVGEHCGPEGHGHAQREQRYLREPRAGRGEPQEDRPVVEVGPVGDPTEPTQTAVGEHPT